MYGIHLQLVGKCVVDRLRITERFSLVLIADATCTPLIVRLPTYLAHEFTGLKLHQAWPYAWDTRSKKHHEQHTTRQFHGTTLQNEAPTVQQSSLTYQPDDFTYTKSLENLAAMWLKIRHHRLPCVSTETVWLATWEVNWHFTSNLHKVLVKKLQRQISYTHIVH